MVGSGRPWPGCEFQDSEVALVAPTVRRFSGLAEIADAVGTELGPTEGLSITQARIDLFAEATDDAQWIHVDPTRATAGPFGETIAHGLLTLSLLPRFHQDMYGVDGVSLAINYGFNKVRFITPVPAGSVLRARAKVEKVDRLDGAAQVTLTTTIELVGAAKPAAVVESVVRYVE